VLTAIETGNFLKISPSDREIWALSANGRLLHRGQVYYINGTTFDARLTPYGDASYRFNDIAANEDGVFALSGTDLYVSGRNQGGSLGIGVLGVSRTRFVAPWQQIPGKWSSIRTRPGGTLAFILSAGSTRQWHVAGSNFNNMGGLRTGNAGFYQQALAPTGAGTGNNYLYQLGIGAVGIGSTRRVFTAFTGNWSQIVCAQDSTVALSAGTTKWFGAGRNNNGQLGYVGANPSVFTIIPGNWSQMARGGNHTMAQGAGLTTWFGSGLNTRGQLGLGDEFARSEFTSLTGHWSQMVCGDAHTMAQSAGTTKWYSTGRNFEGQLGLSFFNSGLNRFTALTGNWSRMVCGFEHTMALSAGTTKWFGTGNNTRGQLGIGDNSNRNAFTPLTGNWSDMVCGGHHTMALSAGTTKWFGTGANSYVFDLDKGGQLGIGTYVDTNVFTALTGNWSQMACGYNHTMALSAGTTKWFGAGSNTYGSLGIGNNAPSNVLSAVPGDWSQMFCGEEYTMALSARTEAINAFPDVPLLDNIGLPGDPALISQFVPILSAWNDVSVGQLFSFARSGNDLYGAGANSNGELGLGFTSNTGITTGGFVQVPFSCDRLPRYQGSTTSIAITGNRLYGAGNAFTNALLNCGANATYTTFTELMPGSVWDDALFANTTLFALSSLITPQQQAQATAPAAPVITNVANDAVNNYINVDFVAGNSFGIPIANYNYSLDDGLSWVPLSPSDNLTPITITNVTDGANYAIRLQTVNIYGGVSQGSNSIEFTFIPNDTLATEAGPSITTDDGRFIFVG
jgi:alpha-tubulin suppressor-like RCC1 family protein